MNLGQLADIASGKGRVSDIAAAMGVTKESAIGTFKGMTSSLYERMLVNPEAMGENTTMMNVLSSMTSSGKDPTAWFKDKKGRKGICGCTNEQHSWIRRSLR
jgi:hypothetical protein